VDLRDPRFGLLQRFDAGMQVKVGEVRHRQHYRASPWPSAEQDSFEPVFVPILSQRPRYPGGFGPLQILVYGSETDRATFRRLLAAPSPLKTSIEELL
jgi:hypothetical protein